MSQASPSRSESVDEVLAREWSLRESSGAFRYPFTSESVVTRTLEGEWGIVAQLIRERAGKRKLDIPEVTRVAEPFKADGFHFGKVKRAEVLCVIRVPDGSAGDVSPLCNVDHDDSAQHFEPSQLPPDSHMLAINLNPCLPWHVLFIPQALSGHNQFLRLPLLEAALFFAASVQRPLFHLVFNSIGAFASVNHCHFQGYLATAPLSVLRSGRRVLCSPFDGVSVARLEGYYAFGFEVFAQDGFEMTREMVQRLSRAAMGVVALMQQRNIAHNVLVSQQGSRIFIFPRRFQDPLLREPQLFIAVMELTGHLIVKDEGEYSRLEQRDVLQQVDRVQVAPDVQQELLDRTCRLFS